MIAFRSSFELVFTDFRSEVLDCWTVCNDVEKQLTFHWALMTLCNETLFLAINFCLYFEMEIDLTFCFSLSFDDVVQRNLAVKLFQHEILQITHNQRTKLLARAAVDSIMIFFSFVS